MVVNQWNNDAFHEGLNRIYQQTLFLYFFIKNLSL